MFYFHKNLPSHFSPIVHLQTFVLSFERFSSAPRCFINYLLRYSAITKVLSNLFWEGQKICTHLTKFHFTQKMFAGKKWNPHTLAAHVQGFTSLVFKGKMLGKFTSVPKLLANSACSLNLNSEDKYPSSANVHLPT